MRKTIIPAMVLLAWSISLPLLAAAGPWPPTSSPAESMNVAITSITQAADPSAAISAFSAVAEPARSSPPVLAAYVQRMVGFGLPEMAFHQAQTLVATDPNNGVGWAVVGFVDAKQGAMNDGLAAISRAAADQPDSAFVQAAAGQLAAWFDMNPMAMTAQNQTLLDSLRKALGTRAGFVTAYNQAKAQFTQSQQPNATAAPAQPQPQPDVAQIGQADSNGMPPLPPYQVPQAGYVGPDYGTPYGGYYAYPDYADVGWWSPTVLFGGSYCVSPFFFGGYGHHHWGGGWGSGFGGGFRGGTAAAVTSGAVAGDPPAVRSFASGSAIGSSAGSDPTVIRGGSATHTWSSGSSAGVIHSTPRFSSGGVSHFSSPRYSAPRFSSARSSGGGRGHR